MKNSRFIIAALTLGAGLFLAGCGRGTTPLMTETREYADSTDHAHFTMSVQLPVAQDSSSSAIRASLIDEVIDAQLPRIGSYEGDERLFPRFDGNAADTDALLEYYRQKAMSSLGALSQEDADEREFYVRENDELTAEEKERILSEAPSWEYDFSLKEVADTLGYAVFLSQNFIYMGGAHGGVTGAGYLTYDRKSGRRVESMLDEAFLADMQPVLMKGLMSYYADAGEQMTEAEVRERLQIEGDLIPLPAWPPYPSKDGLNFVYQQYEIASYADGMPSFTIPYKELKPWLTPEAKALLAPYRF